MIRTTRASLTIKLAVSLASAGCACVILAASAAGATSAPKSGIHYTPEPVPTYEQQLAAGQIQAVTINTKVRALRLTLKDGRHVVVHYAPHQQQAVVAALQAKGLAVLTAKGKPYKPPKPHHHKIRTKYVVIAVVLILIVAGLAWFLIRRRRRAREEY
jgi:ATP-dependent Zn protease